MSSLDEIRKHEITICLNTHMFQLGDSEMLLVNGLLDYYRTEPDIDAEAMARGLRYVADKITAQPTQGEQQ